MSLNWGLNAIKDHKKKCWIPYKDGEKPSAMGGETTCTVDGKLCYLNVITNELIWTTMSAGIREITKKNCIEFYTRWLLAHSGGRSNMLMGGKHIELKFKDVVDHIGLSTNASSKSITEFYKMELRIQERECKRELEELTKEETKQAIAA